MAGANKRLCCVRVCGASGEPSSSGAFGDYVPYAPRYTGEGLTRVPESLLDISAKLVAYHIPFAKIEERYERIPEPVQRRIIYWSFPRNERAICMYSSIASECSGCGDHQKLSFYKGLRLYENQTVENVLQVGFHLSGVVTDPRSSASSSSALGVQPPAMGYALEEEKCCRVSITFDRCKITSVTCSCGKKDIFWCEHVVALALYRIRNPHLVKLRVPISETLLQLDRQQLQKLLQYMIAEHHTEVLPTAQKLADEILQSRSIINRIAGAPDPTAGACAEDEHSWHLDEDQVSEQVRNYLSTAFPSATKQLNALFAKVKEMLRAKDSNAARMLRLITEQFLADPRLPIWRSQGTPMVANCRQLWDQLGALWVCVALNPHGTLYERQHWRALLDKWARLSVCPLEDADFRPLSSSSLSLKRRISALEDSSSDDDEPDNGSSRNRSARSRNPPQPLPRSIFHRALEASHLRWDDDHLRSILDHDGHGAPLHNGVQPCSSSHGQQHWSENIPIAAARVEALRSHGYRKEALRLAVAVVRQMKNQQDLLHNRWQSKGSTSSCNVSGISSNPIHNNTEGWVGHPLDPIGTLFDTLAEASLAPDSKPLDIYYGSGGSDSGSASANAGIGSSLHLDDHLMGISPSSPRDKPKYHHIIIPGAKDRNETYLCLAVEAGLIGLGQQRLMPPGFYAQEKACKQEDRLITKLHDIDLDGALVTVMRKQTAKLIDGGPFSGLGCGIHAESVPMHTFAKFLFNALLPFDSELAYNVGLRAMRLPILEDHEDPDDVSAGAHNAVAGRYPRWFTLQHIESQQCSLAATMLCASRGDPLKLRTVLKSAQRNIHSSTQLFRLAQDAHKVAVPLDGGPRSQHLLSASFELGLQMVRMTLNTMHWKRKDMTRWIVTCATEVGLDALVSIMRSWFNLFAAIEATTVATTIMSHGTVMRLSLDFSQQDELSNCARRLALECAAKDPPNCALPALMLCENEHYSFETAYNLVIDAGSANSMSSVHLFQVAHYMENRGCLHRAYKLALLAIKGIHISYNGENHASTNEIDWACTLALGLGKSELGGLLPIIVKNVQCAPILSNILRKCSIGVPALSSYSDGKRRCMKPLPLDKPPLRTLLDAAIAAYVNTTHSRLTHISPRHYGDFIEFLGKARETFLLASDGPIQFASLIDNMKMVYKGKKKLMFLVKERFG